jgi:hypothetical protein
MPVFDESSLSRPFPLLCLPCARSRASNLATKAPRLLHFIFGRWGARTHTFYVVLSVSTSQAKGVRSACASLRGKLRCVHRAVKRRCGGVLEALFN